MIRYSSKELFEKAKGLIPKHKLIFVEDVVAMLGISKSTFYEHIKVDSYESNHLRGLIEENKIALKVSMRKKWFDSDNATMQMALYKLCSTTQEHKKLQQNYTDVTTKGKAIGEFDDMTDQEIKEEIDRLSGGGGIHFGVEESIDRRKKGCQECTAEGCACE